MGRIDSLRTELTDDPLGRGYAAMDDAAVAVSLNAVNRPVSRGVIPAHEVVDALLLTDWRGIDSEKQHQLQVIISAGSVNMGSPNVRDVLASVAGGTSRTNIGALATEQVSRGVELGLGVVRVGHVQEARR